MASFVPSQVVRELRDLTRRRSEMAVMKGQEAQRLEKELGHTGMKLASMLSDVLGATGRAILSALIDGQRDPQMNESAGVNKATRTSKRSSAPQRCPRSAAATPTTASTTGASPPGEAVNGHSPPSCTR
jgi:DNA-binding IclR family transcriptional regulator